MAGISLGYVDHGDVLSANNDGSLSNISNDDSDLGWSVAGGYLFNDYIGLEVAYLDLGEASFTATSDGSGDSWEAGDVSTKFDADGWLFNVIGRFPMTHRFALVGRLGAYAWETTETFTENGFVSTDKNDGTDVYYGLGIEYSFGASRKWVLGANIARTEVDDDGDAVNMATASFVRKF